MPGGCFVGWSFLIALMCCKSCCCDVVAEVVRVVAAKLWLKCW